MATPKVAKKKIVSQPINPNTVIEPLTGLKPIKVFAPATGARNRLKQGSGPEAGQFIKDTIIADFTERYTFGWVPVEKLLVDRTYQRDYDEKRASIIAHNYKQDLLGTFIVNQRDNGLCYVIDGQTRHGAIQLIENAPENVWAQIFQGLTIQEEAQLYNDYNTKRRALNPYAEFKGAYIAGEPWAQAIDMAAKEAGLRVGQNPAPGTMRAIKTSHNIYRRHGSTFLSIIYQICHAAWPDSPSATGSTTLYGLEYFLYKFPDADIKHLIDALKTTDPKRLDGQGHMYASTLRSSINPATGYAIYTLYNKGLRTRKLPKWDWEQTIETEEEDKD